MPKRRGKDRLKIDRLYRAAEIAERFMPEAAMHLIDRIRNPETKAKDLAACVARLASIAEAKPRIEDDLGLLARRERGGNENPIIAVLGQNVTVAQFKGLPAEEREALLLKALGPAGHSAPPPQSAGNGQVKVIQAQVVTP